MSKIQTEDNVTPVRLRRGVRKDDFELPSPDLAARISARIVSPNFRPARIVGGGSDLSELPTKGATDGKKVGPRCFRFTPNRDRKLEYIMASLGVSNRTVAVEVAIDVLANRLGV